MYKLRDAPDVSNLFTKVEIRFNHYNNGNLSCLLWDIDNNEPYCVATKNLHMLNSKKKAYVDLNNCGLSMIYFLEENEIAKPLGSAISEGYCVYPLYEFDLKMNNKIFYFLN